MLEKANPTSRIGKIKAISISKKKGDKKQNVLDAILKEEFGILGDAHAGTERQVSLLAQESIEKMKAKGLKVTAGDFAENITTNGLDLVELNVGTQLRVGNDVLLEITQKGKECHTKCNIYYQAGDCIMPKEGIFAKVIKRGKIKTGDVVEVVSDEQ